MKKNISAITIYIATIIELLINNKLDLIFDETFLTRYSILKVILMILYSIFVGFLLGIISREESNCRKEKISNLIIIVIPSIIMMLSKFILVNNSIVNIVPQYIKDDKGILILIGGLVLGSVLKSNIKKK